WFEDDSILIFQEDVIVHNGTFSVKDSLISQVQSYADFSQGRFPIQENTQYTFTIWAWDNDSAGRVRQCVSWWPTGSSWSNDYSVDSLSWQELTYTVTSPAGAESALVFVRAYDISSAWDGGAVFYLDDAYFAPPATQPPIIVRTWHMPTHPGPGITEDVYAKVIDDGTIDYDTLYYGVNNLASSVSVSHVSISSDTFRYEIPGQVTGDTVFYYSKFIDNDGLETYSDTHAYYTGLISICINEVYYDTPGADSGCFTEVFGPGMMNLNGFTLVGVNGNDGTDYATIDLAGYVIPNDGFFVVGDNPTVLNVDLVDILADFQNADDNVELRFNGITIDALGYGILNGWVFTGEWLPAVDVMGGYSLGRYPDGHDTDDNSLDFNDYEAPTPGITNPAVGIADYKKEADLLPMVAITNPIRSGLRYGVFISDMGFYPFSIYNTMGQVMEEVSEPEKEITLPTGVYFLRLNNVAGGWAKVVVFK
ncbi:hypothetical protein KAS45_05145, partial [candidate division WOR-3 bacterium]|nr:hypothetical protein [candidate division WOR-3 bacterium]